MSQAPPSFARIVWDGLQSKPALTSALFGGTAIMWIVGIGMFLAGALVGRDGGLPHLAFPLMNISWFTGFMLFQFGQFVSSGSGWQGGAAGEHRRRIWRWLESSEATFVDLSGAATDRAKGAETTKAPSERPDASIIAMPVLTALGSAFLGLAGAMVLAQAHARSMPWDSRFETLFWGAILVFMLGVSLWNVGRATYRVYSWAGERAAVAAQAIADVERARLAALQAQMNPHFLFNTLNTVAALAGPESPRAERVVEHLSLVLRHSMRRGDRLFTSLDDEVRFVREYLAVEQERLAARLRVTWKIDVKTLSLRVPTMSLMPLVENAIAYTIEPRPEGGHIQISAATTAGGYLLKLSVEDDGPGFPAGMHEGHGLGDLHERLRTEYEGAYALDTETLAAGARVTISFPATVFELQSPPGR